MRIIDRWYLHKETVKFLLQKSLCAIRWVHDDEIHCSLGYKYYGDSLKERLNNKQFKNKRNVNRIFSIAFAAMRIKHYNNIQTCVFWWSIEKFPLNGSEPSTSCLPSECSVTRMFSMIIIGHYRDQNTHIQTYTHIHTNIISILPQLYLLSTQTY